MRGNRKSQEPRGTARTVSTKAIEAIYSDMLKAYDIGLTPRLAGQLHATPLR